MSVETLLCPQCSAPMELDIERARGTCPKCGAVRSIELVDGDAPSAKTREALGMPPYALWLFLSGISVTALMFPVLHWWQGRIKPLASVQAAPSAPAKLIWDVTRPPLLVDLNADGIADLIGRYRPDDGAQATMRVGAFDGKTLAPLWTTGSLGEWADALGTVQLALTGSALLLTDAHGGVELRNAQSGELVHRFALVAPAVQACASPDGVLKFWVALADGHGDYVEDAVPQPTPASRPDWCPEKQATGSRARTMSLQAAPSVAGFSPSLVLNHGTDALAVGMLDQVPTLVAFDPSRPGVRWQRAVAPPSAHLRGVAPLGADLVDGIAYVPYQLDDGRRLLALQASSGKQLWDVAIPGRGAGTAVWERLIATHARVFVPEPLGLAVFDTASGQRVGTLGE